MIQSGRSNSSVRAAAGLLALEFWLAKSEPPPCIFVEWGRVYISSECELKIVGEPALTTIVVVRANSRSPKVGKYQPIAAVKS
ncbi:hypothetical protein [Microcoleus sp. A6-C5]